MRKAAKTTGTAEAAMGAHLVNADQHLHIGQDSTWRPGSPPTFPTSTPWGTGDSGTWCPQPGIPYLPGPSPLPTLPYPPSWPSPNYPSYPSPLPAVPTVIPSVPTLPAAPRERGDYGGEELPMGGELGIKAASRRATKRSGRSKELLVAFVLDASGSMSSVVPQTLEGFNAYVRDLRMRKERIRLSTVTFDSDVTAIHDSLPLSRVKPLTTKEYRIGGMTALYDAIGRTVTGIERARGRKRTPVLVVILTDGLENASKEYSRDAVRRLIEEREATGEWTFAYIGAGHDAYAASGSIGINMGNTASFVSTERGTIEAFARLSEATGARLTMAGSGVASTKEFFADAGVAQDQDDRQDPTAPGDPLKGVELR